MKKIFSAALGIAGLLSISTVSATIFTETYNYTGSGEWDFYSYVGDGQFIDFSFDMDSVNDLSTVPTSFTLTEDSVGAVASAPWQSGSLEIDLYSIDPEFERTTIDVVAWNGSLDQILLDSFVWDGNLIAGVENDIVYNFTEADLAIFDDWGLANVSITATSSGGFGDLNDFAVQRVSMSVSDEVSVPEPSTLMLMGLGLLGLGASRLRRKA